MTNDDDGDDDDGDGDGDGDGYVVVRKGLALLKGGGGRGGCRKLRETGCKGVVLA